MKNFLPVCCFILISFFCSQCTNQPSSNNQAKIDYEHLAQAYCECSKTSIELNARMKALLESGDNETFEGLVPKVSEAFNQSMTCCQEAKTKHTTQELDKQKLGGLLKKSCSEMPPRLVLEVLKKIN